MRIQVTRTGGLTGDTRQAEMETTSRMDAPHVNALVREAVATGGRTPTFGTPQGYQYAITVDGRTVYCTDPGLSSAQRELVALILTEGQ